jgi:hypothetical protein
MTLRLVYRLYGGENHKGRPSYYSKLTSLASLLAAAVRAEVEVTTIADGPIPDDLRRMAESAGEVVDLPGGPVGMRASFWYGIRFPDLRNWSDDDVVYFCEDDYLHRADAVERLYEAVQAMPQASYFALSATTADFPAGPGFVEHEDWHPQPDATVGDTRWVQIQSSTSTFAARVGALRADRGIIRQGMFPYRNRLLDHEMCLVWQGRFPYTASELFLGPVETRFRTGARELVANSILTPFRIAYQLRALTRRRAPHLMFAPAPNLATHMESANLSPGTDWASVAGDANRWADESRA